MKFLEIDDPRDVLPIGCKMLKLFGLPRDASFKYWFWLQYAVYIVFGLITRLLMDIDEPIALVRVGSEIVFTIYLLTAMIALYSPRNDIYQLVDMLQECVNKSYTENIHSFLIRTNTKINNSSVKYCKLFLYESMAYFGLPLIATGVVCVKNMWNSTGEQEEYVLPTELNFYYLEIRYNLLNYSIYFLVVTALNLIGALILCTKDVIHFSLIRTVSMLFKVTAMQIRELPPAASQADINVVIRSHRNTLQCATKLQQVMNMALMIQLTSCIVIWCLMLFYVLLMGISSKVLNISLLLFLMTFETYMYCQLGTEFTDAADQVFNALQQLTWYDQSVPIQKQIYFLIQHSQRSIVLKAGKLLPVNIAQFSEIVKKSYSFYLVLKDVF
uniref:Uncharacterized protein n=1 Tax=Anopheles funestus TaxID=62324 RepID=A0A182S599_ANOFN